MAAIAATNHSANLLAKLREAGLTIAPGFQGTGKTYQSLCAIVEYLRAHPDRKVLIYDVNNEYGPESCREHGFNLNIKMLYPDKNEIMRFTAHATERIRRIVPVHPDTGQDFNTEEMKDMLKDIVLTFRKGLLIIEDLNTYLTETKHIQEVLGIITRLRHKNLDIIIHLQSLAAVDTKMWQNCRYLRMHWQADDIDRYKTRIPNFKLIKIAQLLCDYNYVEKENKRFYCWVHRLTNKISGPFTKADFVVALYRYLALDGDELKNAILMNENNREKGLDYCMRRGLSMYGN